MPGDTIHIKLGMHIHITKEATFGLDVGVDGTSHLVVLHIVMAAAEDNYVGVSAAMSAKAA